MKRGALTWCITLSAILCVILTGGWASAQNAQGLTAVGAINAANGYPRWYMDRSGLQLGQCLDTSATDPCAVAAELPDPTQPVSFPGNFPPEFFYWRTTADIAGIGAGGVGKAVLVLALEGAFGGATGTAADGNGAQIVFARYRFRFVPGGLVPGATYTVTSPFGVRSFVAAATGTINFTDDQGCGATPPACDFSLLLTTTNAGPYLTWDPASAPLPPAGFIGDPAIAHTIINSPFNTNFFRITGPNVGGTGVDVVETNLFTNVIGKIYVRPATSTTLNSTPNPSVFGQAVTLTATVAPVVADTISPTGSVTFKDGATTLGTVTLVNGSASIVTAALAAGAHSLTASYSGDLEFAASTPAVRIQTVNPGQTTTTLTSTPNPSLAGQAVTLSTTVTAVAPAVGIPTGTVTFRDGATALATVTLVNGSASLVTSTLATGNHSLTAVYNGSANFLTSTSPAVTQVVNSQTTTTLTASPSPSVIGQAVTLTATVSPVAPGTGVPTGTVTFRDGAAVLGTATLVNGSASISTSTLAVGSHPLTAAYSGGGNFLASTSATVNHTVKPGNTSTSLTSTPNPSTLGQTVTLSATVSPAVGVPPGSVTFRDGATSLGVVTLVNGGASLTVSTLTTGSHALTAVYSGSPNFNASTSPTVTQVVNPGNTTTSLTSTPNPSTFGQTVTLTATVSPVAPATGGPTGTVTFRDGAIVLSTVTLINGSASFQTAALAVGSHPLTATYNGSATFAISTSAVVTQVVNAPAAAATSTSLTSTPNPSTVGQTVTLTATATSAAGVPTGTVTFRDGATVLSTVTLVNGSASFQTAALAAGSHPLTATFNGSAAFAASTSPTVIQVVNAANNAVDTVTINRAEFRAGRGELRVEGTTSQIPGGGFAASVEIHNGAAAGHTCPGALIATTGISATGTWQFRGNTTLTVTTVCVKSAGGGVASRTVTQK